MLVIPAIDIRGGKCVRLRQGDYSQETVFGDDPAAMAQHWVDQGAEMLHLVDLDGAREGRPLNTKAIESIVRSTGVPCQLGGGLRTEAGVRAALELGISRAIVGTQAVRDPEWFSALSRALPGKLVLGLDARDGMVATEGWLEVSSISAVELSKRYGELPLAAIVYTDIAKDGMMSGPNFEMTESLAKSTRIPVVASGGVTTVEDVLELIRRGIGACILGRTIYEGIIPFAELLVKLRASHEI